jgi:hypothetical protein
MWADIRIGRKPSLAFAFNWAVNVSPFLSLTSLYSYCSGTVVSPFSARIIRRTGVRSTGIIYLVNACGKAELPDIFFNGIEQRLSQELCEKRCFVSNGI